jgi:hypothetical protein
MGHGFRDRLSRNGIFTIERIRNGFCGNNRYPEMGAHRCGHRWNLVSYEEEVTNGIQ